MLPYVTHLFCLPYRAVILPIDLLRRLKHSIELAFLAMVLVVDLVLSLRLLAMIFGLITSSSTNHLSFVFDTLIISEAKWRLEGRISWDSRLCEWPRFVQTHMKAYRGMAKLLAKDSRVAVSARLCIDTRRVNCSLSIPVVCLRQLLLRIVFWNQEPLTDRTFVRKALHRLHSHCFAGSGPHTAFR